MFPTTTLALYMAHGIGRITHPFIGGTVITRITTALFTGDIVYMLVLAFNLVHFIGITTISSVSLVDTTILATTTIVDKL